MLRPMSELDLKMVLEWRNNPAVRENMYTTHEISMAEHIAWWQKTQDASSAKYFIYERDNEPLGVVAFTEIEALSRRASWAFYASPNAPKGTGTLMEIEALSTAFAVLKLRKLSCEVLRHNERVINLHKKFGFQVEGIFRRHHLTSNGLEDVIRLSMFASDWEKYLKKQCDEIQAAGKPQGILTVGSMYVQECIFSTQQLKMFGEITGDLNPIHFDDTAAKLLGFPGKIVHGVSLIGEVSKILGMEFPGRGTIIRAIRVTFEKPALPDRLLAIKATVISKIGEKYLLEISVADSDSRLMSGEIEILFHGNS